MRMVANSFCGRSSCVATLFFLFESSCEASSNWVLDKEKKATSEPEIKAEISKRKTKEEMPKVIDQSTVVCSSKLGGSRSKEYQFSET